MFNLFYAEYKEKILFNMKRSDLRLTRLEIISLIMISIGSLGYLIFLIKGQGLGAAVSYSVAVVFIILLAVYRKTSRQRKRILETKIKPECNNRTIEFIKLLKKYRIDYHDDRQLDAFIELAAKKWIIMILSSHLEMELKV